MPFLRAISFGLGVIAGAAFAYGIGLFNSPRARTAPGPQIVVEVRQKPGVVQRTLVVPSTPPPVPAEPEPLPRRAHEARTDKVDLESLLKRTLAKRGLELDDLAAIDLAAEDFALLRAAKARGDERQAELATRGLIKIAETAPLGPAVARRRLARVASALSRLKERALPDRFAVLETRYLDLMTEVRQSDERGDLGQVLVRIAALEAEIRGERAR